MDEIVPRAKEIPPATPPGDLYSVQHQDTRRAEPCRLKRPPPDYEGRWKLFRRAAFFASLMLFVLLVLMAVLKLTTRTRRTSSSRRVGTPPALHEAEERKNSLPGEGPWVSAAAPDPQMMIQAVQALREADALAVIGGWSEAAAAYRRVLDLWPGYAAADAGLGHALLMQGEWALAGQHFFKWNFFNFFWCFFRKFFLGFDFFFFYFWLFYYFFFDFFFCFFFLFLFSKSKYFS